MTSWSLKGKQGPRSMAAYLVKLHTMCTNNQWNRRLDLPRAGTDVDVSGSVSSAVDEPTTRLFSKNLLFFVFSLVHSVKYTFRSHITNNNCQIKNVVKFS